MDKFKSIFLMFFILLLTFFLDSQFPLLLGDFLPRPYLFSSHLVFLVLLFLQAKSPSFALYLVFLIYGILVDVHDFHRLGLATFLYPLLVYLVKKHSGLVLLPVTRFLVMIVLVFVYEGGAYLLAFAYGLTRYPLDLEITYHVMPTLIFNSVMFLLSIPLFKRVTERI